MNLEQEQLLQKKYAELEKQLANTMLELEQKNREMEIEAALERVRSRTIGMQKSDELREVVASFFDQMQHLGFDIRFCSIVLVDPETFDSEAWLSTSEQSLLPESYKVPYWDYPVPNYMLETWRDAKTISVFELSGEIKKAWNDYLFTKTDLQRLPSSSKELISQIDRVFLSSVATKHGVIQVSSLGLLSEENISILNRLAKVFDQTYTRFLDLQKAEAQAREAQIEVALEKVRSRSLSMHKSHELREVVAVVFEKLLDLGFSLDDGAVGILIFSPGSRDHVQWIVDPSNSYASSFEVAYTDHPLSRDLFAARESGKDFFAKIYPVEEKNEYFNYLFEYNESYKQLPVEIKNLILGSKEYGISVTFEKNSAIVIPTNSGKLVIGDNIEILKRFVRVFEQAYIRFLDLQKAEAQAREAQIELALERVRARTMAMQKSDELREAVLVINEQLQHLGFDSNACNIIIIDKESGDMQYWVSGFTQEIFPEGYQVPYLPHPYHDELLAASKQNKKHDLMEYSGELKKSFDDIFFTQTDFRKIPEEAKNFMKALSSVKLSTAFFTYGALQVLGPKELTGERITILERFAKVFDLTYTRFLDLQKAEAQAREAQIEAALERTRTQSMLMQHSSELNNVSNTFHEQLLLLGIPSEFSYVWLPNEEKADHLFWVTWTEDQNGSIAFKNKSITYPLDKSEPYTAACFAMWESGEPVHVIPIPPGEVKQYFATWEELLRGAEKLKAEFFPGGLYYAEAYMKYGCFGILICRQLTQEEKHIFRRFTIEFERAYTRFLDLQKAEAQTREAIKRASVDRVRAEIASMRNTSDLERITPLIWNELTTLGVPFMRCGVFIMDEAQQQVHTYLSTPDGKAIATFHLPYSAPGETAAIIEHWCKKEIYKLHWNEAQFIEFTQTLLQQGAVTTGEKYLTENRPTDLYLHFLPFLQGMLYAGNTTALSDDELQLMQDLADAFSTAYARYEDFKKLEAAKQTVEKTLVDLRQTQQQLVQSEKMASLGELTAGIAHEIQNPLNFVNNFSEVNKELLAEMNEEIEKGNYGEVKILAKDVAENEGKISHHGKRADAIVKGMLQHSRISSGQKEPTDINALCDEYLRLAFHGLRAKDKSFNAKFETKLDNSIGKINIIPQDIGRVLVNLINNAFYAVNEKQKQYTNGYEPFVIVASKKEGDRIELRVTDNGSGIPQKVLDKIFQPFFTTKPAGQGTGLGLSLAYDIIKLHSGEIKVESKEGEGTTFIIRLPENS